jgi:hypothetical protein
MSYLPEPGVTIENRLHAETESTNINYINGISALRRC